MDSGLMGGLYRLSEWIMRFSATNILWVILSSPVLFLGFNLLYILAENKTEQIFPAITMIAVLAPFTLFPATSALFVVTRKWVMGDVDVPLLRTFLRGLKENFKQSVLAGFLFSVAGFLLALNFQFYMNRSGIVGLVAYLMLMLALLYVAALFRFFSMVVHYHMGTLQLIKNAILMSLAAPLNTLMMLATNLAIVFICTQILGYFLVLVAMASVMSYMTFWYFYRAYEKMMQKQEARQNAAEAVLVDSSKDATGDER